MNEHQRLERDLESLQRDHLLVLADAALEAGEELLAVGYRRLAECGAWPLQVLEDGLSRWEWWTEKEEGRSFECSLPHRWIKRVRQLTRSPHGQTCRSPTRQAALRAAAQAWGELALSVHLTGPGTPLGDWRKPGKKEEEKPAPTALLEEIQKEMERMQSLKEHVDHMRVTRRLGWRSWRTFNQGDQGP
jgi:hypothetical protein